MPSPIHRKRTSASLPTAEAAFRRGDLRISDPIQIPRDGEDGLGQQHNIGKLTSQSATLVTHLDGTWPRHGASPTFHTRTRSHATPETRGQLAKSYNITPRTSAGPPMLNPTPSNSTSKGTLGKPKNGGFRSTIRRIFGSKRQRDASPTEKVNHIHANPCNLTAGRAASKNHLPRAASQPVTEFRPSSALSSHSPVEQLDHNDHAPKISIKTRDPTSFHRRRNTLPSITLSAHEAQMLAATLSTGNQLPPPKAAPHSDTELTRGLKRRSRSFDALVDDARSHQMSPIQWRRRSGEIQYWRNTVLEAPAIGQPDIQRPGNTSLDSERVAFRSFAPSPSSGHKSPGRDSLKQFQFGSLPAGGANTATVQQRITTLEVKFNDLEYAIAELQGCHVEKQIPLPRGQSRRSLQDLWPEASAPRTIPSPANHGRTFLNSPTDSPPTFDEGDVLIQQRRSSGAPTIRPDCVTPEQLKTLMSMIASEQSARLALEEQVRQLQTEVEELRNVPQTSYGPRSYPTPSPESRASPNALRGQSIQHSLRFPRSRVGSDEKSRFSATDVDESDAEGSDTDDGFQDVYETPRESQESRFRYRHEGGSLMAGMI